MGKHFNKVFREMCKRVGADWKKINPKKPDWFLEYSWTEEEQNNFKEWMIDYLYNNSEAREEIMEVAIKNKEIIKKLSTMFVFNYGWRIKDNG